MEDTAHRGTDLVFICDLLLKIYIRGLLFIMHINCDIYALIKGT